MVLCISHITAPWKQCRYVSYTNILNVIAVLISRSGDLLLSVNGRTLENIPHAQAVQTLKSAQGPVCLRVVSWPGTLVWPWLCPIGSNVFHNLLLVHIMARANIAWESPLLSLTMSFICIDIFDNNFVKVVYNLRFKLDFIAIVTRKFDSRC